MKVKDLKAVLLPTRITYIDRDGNVLDGGAENYLKDIRERVVGSVCVAGEGELIVEVY